MSKGSQQRRRRADGPVGSVADRSAVEENRALAPETAQESPWLPPVDRQPPCAVRDSVDSEEPRWQDLHKEYPVAGELLFRPRFLRILRPAAIL